jgi:SNF2 family DNA or RNA helicase
MTHPIIRHGSSSRDNGRPDPIHIDIDSAKGNGPTGTYTDYHSQYFAADLSQQHGRHDLAALSTLLTEAVVDVQPHQVRAAHFALQHLNGSSLLADEVGLGKTIEAGLVIGQCWAENKRRILCVVPASIRNQWKEELLTKFGIDSIVLDTKSFNQSIKNGNRNPFDQQDKVVICSQHFAWHRNERLKSVPWDLVVLDEAHRFRNVWMKENKMGKALRTVFANRSKLLLTATPLHNNLMELYGLMSFIDPDIFGNFDAFVMKFVNQPLGPEEIRDLRERVATVMTRTLRKDVAAFVPHTRRHAVTVDFTPGPAEQQLYEGFSEWLRESHSQALPAGNRTLLILVLRKILASSPAALASTLRKMINRLRDSEGADGPTLGRVFDNGELLDLQGAYEEEAFKGELPPTVSGLGCLECDIRELQQFLELTESIRPSEKCRALLNGLEEGFKRVVGLGGQRKALIFTEFRASQQEIKTYLEQNGYAGRVVVFNGSNDSAETSKIYEEWLARNGHQGEASKQTAATSVRTALVDHFRDQADIMIATEAAAEGLNLQFCSLVVNFDLPWNPQRIEQRIGRCHRYGQQHDVVVVNFLNTINAADRRVLELLTSKLKLFEGMFGATDEVLFTRRLTVSD